MHWVIRPLLMFQGGRCWLKDRFGLSWQGQSAIGEKACAFLFLPGETNPFLC